MGYKITIRRGPDLGKGKLTFTGGSSTVKCDCWWDEDDKIPNGTYSAAATYMNKKKNSTGGKREGIFFKNVPGRGGIFVHYWPAGTANIKKWSDGCTVVKEADMLSIWNDIDPKEKFKVTIVVVTETTAPSKCHLFL